VVDRPLLDGRFTCHRSVIGAVIENRLLLQSNDSEQKNTVKNGLTFKILSILFFLLTIGLSVALAQSTKRKPAPVNGRGHFERIDATIHCIQAWNHSPPERKDTFQRRELIKCISDAWRFQDAINATMNDGLARTRVIKDSDAAITLANESLWLLGFKKANNSTAKEFIEFAIKESSNNSNRDLPELGNPSSAERIDFTKFVAKALEFEKFKSK
jgi:hypothetical protein